VLSTAEKKTLRRGSGHQKISVLGSASAAREAQWGEHAADSPQGEIGQGALLKKRNATRPLMGTLECEGLNEAAELRDSRAEAKGGRG